jgi:hypothetical protein
MGAKYKIHKMRATCQRVTNKKNTPIYVPVRYLLRLSEDSVIMEAIYKPDKNQVKMSYNAFVPPEMKRINITSSLLTRMSLSKTLNRTLKISKYKFFFRVYYRDDRLLLENKEHESSESEFLDFEKKNSILIGAKTRA